jgi:hypothetical protein
MRSRSLPVALCFANIIRATAGTKDKGGEKQNKNL